MTDSELDCIKRIGELKRERAKLLKVLKHAQEAIFWYDAEGFEQDGMEIGALLDDTIADAEGRP